MHAKEVKILHKYIKLRENSPTSGTNKYGRAYTD